MTAACHKDNISLGWLPVQSLVCYHPGSHGAGEVADSPTFVGNRKWSLCHTEGSLSK